MKQGDEESDILIPGQANRNRAIHGDRIVVELYPKSQWKSRIFSLVNESESSKQLSHLQSLTTEY